MDGFYEVQHSDGAHVYFAVALARTEIDQLQEHGFVVIKHSFERNPSQVYPLTLN